MSNGTARKEKLIKLEEAVAGIPSGSMIAVGGLSLYGSPMAMVREIIRQGIRDLNLILPPGSSIAADLLIGAGCVREVFCSYIGFEDLGLAPSFRRAAEAGKIKIVDTDETFVVCSLKAGGARSPFYVLHEGMAGYQVADVNPHYFRVTDPRTGKSHLCIAAINPDVALIHVGQCDAFGNARHLGNRFTDVLMAKAANKVIISCDNLVDVSVTQENPQRTSIPSFMVHGVVHAPYGAHPTSSPGVYQRDDQHLRMYLDKCASEEGSQAYLKEFVLSPDFAQYKDKIGVEKLELLSERNLNA